MSDFLLPVLTEVVRDSSAVGPVRHQQADGCEWNPDRKRLKELGDDVAQQRAQCEPINKVSNVVNGPVPAATASWRAPTEANKDHFHTRDHFNAGEVQLLPQSNNPTPPPPQICHLTCTRMYTTARVVLAAR